MSKAAQLEREAAYRDALVAHAEATARRVHIASCDEIEEWLGTYQLGEYRVRRTPHVGFVVRLFELGASTEQPPQAMGDGETFLDAFESAFRDLAERYRNQARVLRARANEHAA